MLKIVILKRIEYILNFLKEGSSINDYNEYLNSLFATNLVLDSEQV